MAEIQAVINALNVFSTAPDKASLDQANNLLQDFQHSTVAWNACNALLRSPSDLPAKIFAAQTFRVKVTYDLNQLGAEDQVLLKNTLIGVLEMYQGGPRTIIVQLCLALAGVALQLTPWENPVQDMISKFGRSLETQPVLLQFLTLLPEELTSNTKIPITDDEYDERARMLLTANVDNVLDLLSKYIEKPGLTTEIQTNILLCMRSWLVAGEIRPLKLVNTPLFGYVFEGLVDENLFDLCIDVLCEIIKETQEIEDEDNGAAIKILLPKIIQLKSKLEAVWEDDDKIKGYARLFSEAGETYRMLLVDHLGKYHDLIDAIGLCSAHPDLEVVPITFPFWMRLAGMLGKMAQVPLGLQNAFKLLMQVIIKHLRFPSDTSAINIQEADTFRSFRHVMGDTLKDCCVVLGTDNCLMMAYHMIGSALEKGPNICTWQEIEAPLFAMRSMGAEINNEDEVGVPKILDMFVQKQLPDHPRVRYAALLIIARYTEWINLHPSYINPLLPYIYDGFKETDSEVNAAAGQALKFLCQDCNQHLLDLLPALSDFLKGDGTRLIQEDRRQVYEAIAHVISAMPLERAVDTLRKISSDLLSLVENATAALDPQQEHIQQASDALENLETMLYIVRSFGEELPPNCQKYCRDSWSVLEKFLLRFGSQYELAERVTRVIRHGITIFGIAGLLIAPSILAVMTEGFRLTGVSSYIWIGGKIVARYGEEKQNVELQTTIHGMYTQVSKKAFELLSGKPPGEIPDVLQDYIQMLLQIVYVTPEIFFDPTVFPHVFNASMAGLTVVHSDIIFATLQLFRATVMHESLQNKVSGENTEWAAAIRLAVQEQGYALTGYLLKGMIEDFPEDASNDVVSIFCVITTMFPKEMLGWLPRILQQLPTTSASEDSKAEFLKDLANAVGEHSYEKVRYSITTFDRMSRRARDRRRMGV